MVVVMVRMVDVGDVEKTVEMVVKGKEAPHGVILWGPPGHGKSTFAKQFADVEVKGGHITPFVLFEKLYEHRDEVVLVDDLNTWSDEIIGVLMQALDTREPRVVEWNTTYAMKVLGIKSFVFTGKIIITTNVYPTGTLVDALFDRVTFVKWDKTEEILREFPEDVREKVVAAGMVSYRYLNMFRERPELFWKKLNEALKIGVIKQVAEAWEKRAELRQRDMTPWDYLAMGRATFFRYLRRARELGMVEA